MRITNEQKKALFKAFSNSKLEIKDFEIKHNYTEFSLKFKHDYFSFVLTKSGPTTYTIVRNSITSTEPHKSDVK